MPKNPPENTPRIVPYLYYEDVDAALPWLAKAFGLRERMRVPGPDGKVMHAEMEMDDGLVMMGCPSPEYRNPKHVGHATQSLYVYTDDVDKHYRRAVEAGAKIVYEPADQFYGDRNYGAEDPEGHVWYFAKHVRDVAPEEMAPKS
jgi:PhnB protein